MAQWLTLTRDQVYELVWSTPIVQLARRFGLSDVGLAKQCDRNDIPLPPRGYWARVAAGQQIEKTPLRPSFRYGEGVMCFREVDEKEVKNPTVPDDFLLALREAGSAVRVPDVLPAEPHALVAIAKTRFERAKIGEKGLLIRPKKPCLAINVGPLTIERTLRVWNGLLSFLESQGLEARVTRDDPSRTLVKVLGEDVAISISEVVDKHERKPVEAERPMPREFQWHRPVVEFDYVPTGSLTIHVQPTCPIGTETVKKNFSDAKGALVERRFGTVAVGLHRVAQAQIDERIASEQRQRQRAEEERLSQKRRDHHADWVKRREQEKKYVEHLIAEASAFRQARMLREYIDATMLNGASAEGLKREELESWATWARQQADRIDPLTPSPPSILDEPEPPRY